MPDIEVQMMTMMVLEAFLYGLLSIILLIVGFMVLDFVVPCDFRKEIFEEKNTAVGVLAGGLFVALGLIVRSSVIGGGRGTEDGMMDGLFATLVFSGTGLVLFVAGYLLLALLFRKENLHRHIDEHNTAVGFALAGFFIAIALAVSGSIQ
jgi:putative membrane protein